MLCNQAVSQARLREESISQEMRVGQRYINEDDAPAPSVITLNALGASQAANDFLFYITGLVNDDAFGGTIQGRPLTRTQIGRAHVFTPVTNAHLVCRLLLEQTNIKTHNTNKYN